MSPKPGYMEQTHLNCKCCNPIDRHIRTECKQSFPRWSQDIMSHDGTIFTTIVFVVLEFTCQVGVIAEHIVYSDMAKILTVLFILRIFIYFCIGM